MPKLKSLIAKLVNGLFGHKVVHDQQRKSVIIINIGDVEIHINEDDDNTNSKS